MRHDAGWWTVTAGIHWNSWMIAIGAPYVLPGYLNLNLQVGPASASLFVEPGRQKEGPRATTAQMERANARLIATKRRLYAELTANDDGRPHGRTESRRHP